MEHRETARAGPTNFRSRDLPRQRRSVSTRSSRAEEVLNYQAIHLGECQLTVSMMIMAVKAGNIPLLALLLLLLLLPLLLLVLLQVRLPLLLLLLLLLLLATGYCEWLLATGNVTASDSTTTATTTTTSTTITTMSTTISPPAVAATST